MARVNIYLPDDLAKRAREAGLNVSGIAQEALEAELRIHDNEAWFEEVFANPPDVRPTHEQIIAALDEVRAEAGDDFPPGYDTSNP